jgi:hypothetical protein
MDPYQELRRQATKKRDVAVKLAHREYEATLRKIEELEERFYSNGPQKAAPQRIGFPGHGRPEGEMTLGEKRGGKKGDILHYELKVECPLFHPVVAFFAVSVSNRPSAL